MPYSKQRVILCALLCCCFAFVFACSKKSEPDPFTDHWKKEAEQRQGYSPAPADLQPQPRVIMQQTDAWDRGSNKPLPTMPVTLKLHSVDVSVAVRSLAAAAGINIMVSPGVSGSASLNVQKTPWRDVFLSLLRANGLEYRWQGNILQVLTAVEKQKEISMLALNNQLAQQHVLAQQNGPISVSVISVRYAEAQALKTSLSSLLGKNQEAIIEVDEHSNALVVQASAAAQRRIVQLVEHLDRPRPQVQLKAYIVEATKETARELGTKWGGVIRSGMNSNGQRFWAGSAGTGTFGVDPVTGGYGTAGGMSGQPIGLDYSAQVAGTGAGALSFMFGAIGGNVLEMQLNLMEKDGQLNILSSPSITTLDNKMAYTENGEKVPYVTKNTDGDNEVKFEEAVLRLEMTPNVIDGANLKLKVLVKKDEVDSSRAVDGNPYIIKKQTETTLIMRTGETVVISGLTKEKGVNTEAGVPGLKNLPGGKYVFGSTNRTKNMEEVMIFITPVILPTRTALDMQPRTLPDSPPVLDEDKAKAKPAAASMPAAVQTR
ncbi:MAG: secretin N-terminal domain-containing protein [Desulfovibrionaceae bacterium]|nr:secretin N-terminal domain-containing protein [Desulfovibrionaceae bacterium]